MICDTDSHEFLHPVERRASLEPGDLLLVECVVEGDVLIGAVGVVERRHHRPSGRKVDQIVQGDLVVRLDLVVVGLQKKGDRA